MKKFLSLVMLLVLVCSCAWAESPMVSYLPLYFHFWGDPTQGYEWSCGYEENGVLGAPSQSYVESVGGTGGDFEFIFEVLGAGKADIAFNYGLSDGLSLPSQTVLCTVVAHNGDVSVRWARRYSDDHTVEVILPADAASGLEWSYISEENDMVQLTSQEFVPADDSTEGDARFVFSVEQPGATQLRFLYGNPWNPEDAATENYALDLTVNESMEISMAVAND